MTEFLEDLKKQYNEHKKIKILLIGDHKSGKTSYFKQYCNEIKDPALRKNALGVNSYIKIHTIYNNYINDQNQNTIKYVIEFLEICGEKNYKDAVTFYIKQNMIEIKAIFFTFDITNTKSLFNFYMWIKFLLEIEGMNNDVNSIWEKPFLILGMKDDLLNLTEKKNKKKQILNYFCNLFICTNGENILNLSAGKCHKNELNYLFLDLFINQLCIQEEINEFYKNKEENNELLYINRENLLDFELLLERKKPSNYRMNRFIIMKNIFFNTVAKETIANLLYQFLLPIINYNYYESSLFKKVLKLKI